MIEFRKILVESFHEKELRKGPSLIHEGPIKITS